MCRSLRILCAAPAPDRLAALKRAAVSASWELVGGADSAEALRDQIERWSPDVVVVDGSLGPGATVVVRGAKRRVRLVSVGPLDGADAQALSLDAVRDAILGLPPQGGPIRT